MFLFAGSILTTTFSLSLSFSLPPFLFLPLSQFSEDSNSVLDSVNDENNHKKAKHENGAEDAEESNDANDAGKCSLLLHFD